MTPNKFEEWLETTILDIIRSSPGGKISSLSLLKHREIARCDTGDVVRALDRLRKNKLEISDASLIRLRENPSGKK